jgi:F0F1-type ATP synthase beta subunit
LPRRRKGASLVRINELVFEITQESDGGFVAEGLGESIITQADTWEELRANVREAVKAFYFDRPAPARLRLHLVRDEVIA